MNFIVYKTTNLINGRFYVGVHGTSDINVFDGYIGSGNLIKAAIKRYGAHNFRREILINCFDDEEEAYSIESLLVKTNKEDPRSYNLRVGGGGWFNARKNFTKAMRVEISMSGGNKLVELGKSVFQTCTKEDRIKYAKKSNETKKLNNSVCNFKSIEWQRENSKRNDHSGAKGTRKYHDGINVYTFKPSNRHDSALTEIELANFLKEHPGILRGGVKQLNKISK